MSTAYLRACLVAFGCAALLGNEASGQTEIAQGKPARQSSNYFSDFASKAVDGNSNPFYSAGSCSHTGNDNRAWWEVDLLHLYNVESVQITRRSDIDIVDRVQNFKIEISVDRNDDGDLVNPCLCYHRLDAQPLGTTENYPCRNQQRVGRYVRIQLQTNAGYLTLCEVKVFGTRYPFPNLALSHPAFQSSVFNSATANLANDGVVGENSCAITELNEHASWVVYLGGLYRLTTVRITRRNETGQGSTPTNFKIETSNTRDNYYNLFNTGKCADGPDGQPVDNTETYTCGEYAVGSYLRIQILGVDQLTLCEVEVFGYPADCLNRWDFLVRPGTYTITLEGYLPIEIYECRTLPPRPPQPPQPPQPPLCCEHVYRDRFCPNFAYAGRSLWGAAPAMQPGYYGHLLASSGPKVDVTVQYASLGSEFLTCRTMDDCSRHVRILQDRGLQQSDDIAENFVVSPQRRIYVGRGWDAATYSPNQITIGILGTKTDVCTDNALLEMVAEFLKCLLARYNRDYDREFAIFGVLTSVNASSLRSYLCGR